jgi:hypothetical protein
VAKRSMDLTEFVGKILAESDVDALREGVRILAQAFMGSEVTTKLGAEPFERTPDRTGHRNGYRGRRWDTRVGTIELRIPKVTPGTYFPTLLEPRRRAERALVAVVQEAYVHGVSTRKVDDLVKALGMEGISRSEVSRMCSELDEAVEAFLSRPIEGDHPYVWLDATFHKVRENGKVVSLATVVAIGVMRHGRAHGAGHRRRPGGGPCVLAGLSQVSRRPGPERRPAGDLRRPPGPPAGDRAGAGRCLLATVICLHRLHWSHTGRAGRSRPPHLHRRERALATRPSRSSGRPAPPAGGGLLIGQRESCLEHRDERPSASAQGGRGYGGGGEGTCRRSSLDSTGASIATSSAL